MKSQSELPSKKGHCYGKNQEATFKSRGDVTHEQEYKSGGLPKMDKYSVDKK